MSREISVVTLAAMDGPKLLLVRKRGLSAWILPGGKPEPGESPEDTLRREIFEELGCGVETGALLGVFRDVAAGDASVTVAVSLFAGLLAGQPSPRAEIEEISWLDVRSPGGVELAPSLANSIMPFLASFLGMPPHG